ncbi:hypothetical protein [Brasilonema sp. UFV-L1]|uniref:hypothetical protein n=1 Tax=Brasilonema sp. UFV-L1 TaxID=2234130 RepID=UPI0030DA8AB9
MSESRKLSPVVPQHSLLGYERASFSSSTRACSLAVGVYGGSKFHAREWLGLQLLLRSCLLKLK